MHRGGSVSGFWSAAFIAFNLAMVALHALASMLFQNTGHISRYA